MINHLENLGPDPHRPLVHATAIAGWAKGVLIIGPSGVGKSSLALQLMALGGTLISDDRVYLSNQNGITLERPTAMKGRIEARGMGILTAATLRSHPLDYILELSQHSEPRLPLPQQSYLLGVPIAHVKLQLDPATAAKVVQLLKGGFYEDASGHCLP